MLYFKPTLMRSTMDDIITSTEPLAMSQRVRNSQFPHFTEPDYSPAPSSLRESTIKPPGRPTAAYWLLLEVTLEFTKLV